MTVFLRLNRLVLILLIIGTASALWAASTIDRTIAKLNDDILTESDLAEVVADVAGDFNPLRRTGYEGATSDTVRAMFDRALLLQEARRKGIKPENEELHRQVEGMVRDIRANFSSDTEFHHALAAERLSLDQLKKELLDKTKTDFMVYHIVSMQFSVSDQEIEQYRQEQEAAGELPVSFRLRRLGIPVKKGAGAEAACREARALVARIITEGIPFEEGIRKYSQVPGASADGGDMGYISIEKLSAEVRSAVESLEVGQASAPVVAGDYANIFYVEGKRGAQSAVKEKRFFEARKQLLERLRRKAILQVFDQRLMKIMPDDYQQALVAAESVMGSRSAEAANAPADQKQEPQAAPAQQQYPEQQPNSQPQPTQYQQPQQPQHPHYQHPQYQQPQATPQTRRFPWFGRQQQ